MQIKCFDTGPIQTNTFIVSKGNEALIVDPAALTRAMADYIEKNSLAVKYILLTHGHFDHLLGVNEVKEKYNAKVIIGINEAEMVNDASKNGSAKWTIPLGEIKIDKYVSEGDEIKLSDSTFKVIETPGHSKGGVSYYSGEENVLFSGDTLFAGSIGRTDLYGGNMEEIRNSIVNKLYRLPDNTIVYPGHSLMTSIGEEKINNGYFRA